MKAPENTFTSGCTTEKAWWHKIFAKCFAGFSKRTTSVFLFFAVMPTLSAEPVPFRYAAAPAMQSKSEAYGARKPGRKSASQERFTSSALIVSPLLNFAFSRSVKVHVFWLRDMRNVSANAGSGSSVIGSYEKSPSYKPFRI